MHADHSTSANGGAGHVDEDLPYPSNETFRGHLPCSSSEGLIMDSLMIGLKLATLSPFTLGMLVS